jgi:glutathione peroxidase
MIYSDIYSFSVLTSDGQEMRLSDWHGKVLLIVNTASQCGFTPQYAGLEQLYQKYQPKGFVVLAFPCNQFGQQEAGSDSEIRKFCKDVYQISFPVMAKIDVNGTNAHPLFQYLKITSPGILGGRIWWNFTKFLIDPEGKPVRRYAPWYKPEKIESHLQRYLPG